MAEESSTNGATAEVALENKLLRLFLDAYFDETTHLMEFVDESLEDVSTESDSRFAELRRLRTLYQKFMEAPDEAALTAIFEEMSDRTSKSGK